MKCVLCDARKGKRFCPAKERLICAQCCGEKRVIEVRCPPDCTYLSSGNDYQRFKDFTAQIYSLESPEERRKTIDVSIRYDDFLSELERTVVQYAADLRSLDDRQVSEAVSALMETYQTESKGIIYEHSSANPLAQALARKLRETAEKYRETMDPEDPPLGASQIADCLKVVQLKIRHYQKGSGRDYLTFIRRNHPDLAGTDSPGLISL